MVQAYQGISQHFTFFHPEPASTSSLLASFHIVSKELSDVGLGCRLNLDTRLARNFLTAGGNALNTSAVIIVPLGRTGMTSRFDQHTDVYGGMSLATMEEGKEDPVERETEQQFGLPALDASQRADQPGPTAVARETREFLTALVLNVAACQRWLSADPPDIREVRATMERMTSDARALTELINTSGHDSQA
jgi:hypothetical protein